MEREIRSVSRGDTKNVCLLFNSLLPPKSEKGERERRKNVSLFSKKTLSFSLSLSLQLFLFLSSICFGCRFVFFFFSFALLFVGEIKRWSSLSFSLVFVGEIGNHIRLSLSLSLLRRARFGKPDLPLECSAAHAERGIVISEKEEIDASDTLARESRRKKKMDWISSHCGTRTPQPQIAVASKTKTHIYPRTNLCARVLPSVRPRGACLQNSFFLCCFNIYVCVCIFCVKDLSLINAFVCIYVCCIRVCTKTREENV